MINTLYIKRMMKPDALKTGDFIQISNMKRTPDQSAPLEEIEKLLGEISEIRKGDNTTRFEGGYRITVIFRLGDEYWTFLIACNADEYIEAITTISR